MRRLLPLLLLLALTPPSAQAVIVRGKVTSPLGVPLAGARVQLIHGPRSVADAISGIDGTYEIRIDLAGRFLLLTAPSVFGEGYAPQVGTPFYAGRSDLVTIDIALNHAGITPQLSPQPTLIQRPIRQLSTPITQIADDELLTHTGPIPEIESTPGAIFVEHGQLGSSAYLYLRGAPPQTLATTIDSVPANPLGGAINLSTFSATALSAISPAPALELAPVGNPLFLTGSESGVLTVRATDAQTLRPTLTYTGDAGNLNALRNEAVATYAHSRYDLLGAFSRFDIANSIPAAPYHLVTWAANAGYHISAGTSLRFTARDDLSAAPLSSPFEIFLTTPQGREADQNLFASATFETRTASDWHNLVRYGLARTREQTFDYFTPATGLPVTVLGANGYTASGTAAFDPLPSREDAITNRDEAVWQTDYRVKPWLTVLGDFRFQDERAADILPAQKQTLARTHLSAAFGLQGGFRQRFFYETSGFFDHTQLLGFTGAPRLGLTYVPVRPGLRKFRGTSLHLTLATGVREPSLLEQAASPLPPYSPRSRTLDASVDQNLLSQKLTLRATYFHSQFSHEFEPFGLSTIASHPLLDQALALRTQGLESDLRYQPWQRFLLEAGYSYLAALTEQSAATPAFNPNLPAIPIGALTALTGQRPFHRPPQSGFFLAEYSGSKLNAVIKGAAVSHSDDSTNLLQSPDFLLPNRNLSPGYLSLDANVSFVFTRHITVITQLTNLSDNRHIAPIGFLSTPFLIRTGLRIRLGGE
jgi:vitamin B12 transporter